jgi:basic amino acid/polyamine antiporter, APA family
VIATSGPSAASPQLVRAIGRWSLAALVLNSILGSGIFGLPSDIAKLVGSSAPLAYVLVALGMGLIVACFAEVSSRFTEAGGPYLYARVAFGRFVGLQVGWMAGLVRVTAAAANANLFVVYLGEFWPQATNRWPRIGILLVLLGVLTVINYRGVKSGARVTNFFTVAKLLPLAVFVAAGAFFLFSSGAAEPVRELPQGSVRNWLEAVLLLVFAYGGFEAALMPLAEAKDPRRDAPFALGVVLAFITVLYISIQLIVMNTLADPTTSQRPLAAAAHVFMGSLGAGFISVGALLSIYGYLSSMMVMAPRLPFALAERGDFPSLFARVHERFRTPHFAIVLFAVLLFALAAWGGFRGNATLSAVSRLLTYAPVCLALIVLRRKQPGDAVFRLPGGEGIAVLGIVFSLLLIAGMRWVDMPVIAGTAMAAAVYWWFARK